MTGDFPFKKQVKELPWGVLEDMKGELVTAFKAATDDSEQARIGLKLKVINTELARREKKITKEVDEECALAGEIQRHNKRERQKEYDSWGMFLGPSYTPKLRR
jgi:hypothetical protein